MDCDVPECDSPPCIRGWCNAHYLRWRRHGDPIGGSTMRSRGSLADRFWMKVDKGRRDECWPWKASLTTNGYGQIKDPHKRSSVLIASRASWIIHHGQIPKGMHVLHKCDNPPCVNPHHLFLGPPKDNVHDMIAKARGVRGSKTITARLDDEKVREIRRSYDEGQETQQALADRFGVARSTIGRVVRRVDWAWLT